MPTRAKPARNPVSTERPTMIRTRRSRRLTLVAYPILHLIKCPPSKGAVRFFVFFTGVLGHVVRQSWCRRLLIPTNGFQIITYILLVIGRLCSARMIRFD